jgi:hypothetical protein
MFTEKQLLIKLQKGDEQAFAEIYNTYKLNATFKVKGNSG